MSPASAKASTPADPDFVMVDQLEYLMRHRAVARIDPCICAGGPDSFCRECTRLARVEAILMAPFGESTKKCPK
jgi:hypothetical protein